MAPWSSHSRSKKFLITPKLETKLRPRPRPAALPLSASAASVPAALTASPTRDHPNMSDCHCCGYRVNRANPKDRLELLDSIWRIVLLCRACGKDISSGHKCPYCFHETGNSGNFFQCSVCERKIHENCIKDCGNCTPWCYLGSPMDGFRVCIDCWVPDLLKHSSRVWGKSENEGRLKGNGGAKTLLEREAKDPKRGAEKVNKMTNAKGRWARNPVDMANVVLALPAINYKGYVKVDDSLGFAKSVKYNGATEGAKAEKSNGDTASTEAEKPGITAANAKAEKSNRDAASDMVDKPGISAANAKAEKTNIDAFNAKDDKSNIAAVSAKDEKSNIGAVNAKDEKSNIGTVNAKDEKSNIAAANAKVEKSTIAAAKAVKSSIAAGNANTEKCNFATANVMAEKSSIAAANAKAEKFSIAAANAKAEKSNIAAANAKAEKSNIAAANAKAEKSSIPSANAKAEISSIAAANAKAKKTNIVTANVKAEISSIAAANAKAEKTNIATANAKAEKSSFAPANANAEKTIIASANAKAEKSSISPANANAEKTIIASANAKAEKSSIAAANAMTEKTNIAAANANAEKSNITAANAMTEKSSIAAANTMAEKSTISAASVKAEKSGITSASAEAEKSGIALSDPKTENSNIAAANAKADRANSSAADAKVEKSSMAAVNSKAEKPNIAAANDKAKESESFTYCAKTKKSNSIADGAETEKCNDVASSAKAEKSNDAALGTKAKKSIGAATSIRAEKLTWAADVISAEILNRVAEVISGDKSNFGADGVRTGNSKFAAGVMWVENSNSTAIEVVDDAELAIQLHRAMNSSPRICRSKRSVDSNSLDVLTSRVHNGLDFKRSCLGKNCGDDPKLEADANNIDSERIHQPRSGQCNEVSGLNSGLLPYKRDRKRKVWQLNDEETVASKSRSNQPAQVDTSLHSDDASSRSHMKSRSDLSGASLDINADQNNLCTNVNRFGEEFVGYSCTQFKLEGCQVNCEACGPVACGTFDNNEVPSKSGYQVNAANFGTERDCYNMKHNKRVTGTQSDSTFMCSCTFESENRADALALGNSDAGCSEKSSEELNLSNRTCNQDIDRYCFKYAKRMKGVKSGSIFESTLGSNTFVNEIEVCTAGLAANCSAESRTMSDVSFDSFANNLPK